MIDGIGLNSKSLKKTKRKIERIKSQSTSTAMAPTIRIIKVAIAILAMFL